MSTLTFMSQSQSDVGQLEANELIRMSTTQGFPEPQLH